MARYAEQLRQHDANDLSARRHLDARHLLHIHHVRQIVHHAAEVVDAIRVGNVGVPTLALGHFFLRAVVIADIGDRLHDHLPVHLQRDAEYAVYARVIGAQVEKHEVRVFRRAAHAPLLGHEPQTLLLRALEFRGHRERIHFRRASRVLLAQRVTLPMRRRENAAQVRMSLEVDAEHVVRLAFVPVGYRVDARDGRHARILLGQRRLDPQVRVVGQGNQVIKHGEAGIRLAVAEFPGAFIDGGEVEQQFVALLVLETAHDLRHMGPLHPQRRNLVYRRLWNAVAESRSQYRRDRGFLRVLDSSFRHEALSPPRSERPSRLGNSNIASPQAVGGSFFP